MPFKYKKDHDRWNKIYVKRWYKKHKKWKLADNARRKKAGVLWVWEYKEKHPCEICGESNPSCLVFHHNGKKELNISVAVRNGWSIKHLEMEIKKCNVWCGNCHMKYHFKKPT